jgi:mannose-1-phosphate guanylyltransferase
MRHAVILAGGSGTRLWPASRRALPKQLLPLVRDGEPMIMGAVSLARKIGEDRVMIVTAEEIAEATMAAVDTAEALARGVGVSFQGVEILAEPTARNTAAAIGLASAIIAERDPDATLVILPADHHVRDPDALAEALDVCATCATQGDVIALVGIPPTRAETGFGYLEMAAGPSDGIRDVVRFVEKPDRTTAESYIASGRYLWNAGIFCLTARRLLTELDKHLPETARAVRQIARGRGVVLDPSGLYKTLPSISFDHGVMERTSGQVVAIPAAVGWNDVGSWAALPEVRGTCEISGNTLVGTVFAVDSTDNVIVSDGEALIATIGVSDLIIVKAGDAILVVHRDQAQRVKELVESLARGHSRYL